jgi:tyrosine-protein kinase
VTLVQESGGLPELLDAIRWRWKLAVLIAVPIFLGALIYAQALPAQYDGVAIVSIAPEPDQPNTSGDLIRVLAPKYVAYITAPATLNALASRTGETGAALRRAVSATVATDTGNITISVRLSHPQQAARAANVLADQMATFSTKDPLLVAQVIAPATVPDEPSGPPRKFIALAALLVGAILGLAVASVIERGRPRARTWRDIAILTGHPVIGRLPSSRALRGHPGTALSDASVGAAARTLRTNLERDLGGQPRGAFVVTSPTAGEGKTTVAALFATALARLDIRVLLIDADLRRPGLDRTPELEAAGGGLSGLLRGSRTFAEVVEPGWMDRLWVMPTSPDPDAGDLLARRFAEVLREARDLYDAVVVDSPPLLGTDDARTLATLVDGVLLVVSAGTMARPLSEAVLALRTLRAPVLGVVANRVREPSGPGSYAYSTYGT